jgi:hypothetical protein
MVQAVSCCNGVVNTKQLAVVDECCYRPSLNLTAGTEAVVVHAPLRLESVNAEMVFMDKFYDNDALLKLSASMGRQFATLLAKPGSPVA